MRVAIIGARGIPNYYGGFEQFAEYLAVGLVEKGFDVLVYNSHNHPVQDAEWRGVKRIHCYDPEFKLGTVGQFVYDLNCIRDVRKRDCDVILQLGYTSSSVWSRLLPSSAVITTNMDGLEWKRTKYSEPVKRFLQYAEKLAVKFSDHLIADSIGIQDYIKKTYGQESEYIPYGAHVFNEPDVRLIGKYDLVPYDYDLLIARLEPENSIEIILEGAAQSNVKRPFLVIGKHETKYGQYLKALFRDAEHIRFLGGIYDMAVVNNIRYYSNLYFHGHTVGGTNPSLLEAMASSALICANDNAFNSYILGGDAVYFRNASDVAHHVDMVKYDQPEYQQMIVNNLTKIEQKYSWDKIIDAYANHFSVITGTQALKPQAALEENEAIV